MKSAFASFALAASLSFPFAPIAAFALEPGRASDLVTLVADEDGECPIAGQLFDRRVLADGSQEPFTMPAKRVLVITGFEFVRSGATPGAAIPAIVTQQPTGAVVASPLIQATGVADVNGLASGSAFAAPGVAARGGVPLCLGGAGTAILRGFLAKDK
jgi:hypothetical protein